MDVADSPTARALRTLELLQASPGITADQLSWELGVSERTARRYVGMLREAGIRVDATRGKYGGYTVSRGLRVPPLVFSSTEALALVMAVLDGHHDAAALDNPVGGALDKIMRALPESVAAGAEAVRQMTLAAPDRGAARPDPGITATLVQACTDRKVVEVGYRIRGGQRVDRGGGAVVGGGPSRPLVSAVSFACRCGTTDVSRRPDPASRRA